MGSPRIGGTAAAALAGVNPPGWQQPIDVYQQMIGEAPERPPSRMMMLGRLMEGLVADLAGEAYGVKFTRPPRRKDAEPCAIEPEGCTATLSREYPWAQAHIDRFAYQSILECKWSMRRDEWGEQGTSKVPLRYAVQVHHYLAVTGRPVAILAVLLGYGDFRHYRIERNETTIGWLMELEERFVREHVEPRVPPPPDGSAAYERHLRRLYPESEPTEAVATPEQRALLDELRMLRDRRASLDEEEASLRQRIMDGMGTTEKLVAPGAVVHWPTTKPRLVVQWEELATLLLPQAHPDIEWPATKKAQAEAVRAFAKGATLAEEKAPTRPFRVDFAEEEAE